MPDTWRWNQIPSYRLKQADVEDYLKKKFGNWKFYTQVSHIIEWFLTLDKGHALIAVKPVNDQYKFWIPRDLTSVSVKTRAWPRL